MTGSLTKLTWNLAEGSIRTQKTMIIGKEAAYIPLVVQTEDGGRKRDVYVLKKDLEQLDATESCAACAMFTVSADTTLGTTQSKEYRERMKELSERQAAESAADPDKIRRREKSSEAPVKQRNCDRPLERSRPWERS